ncbi:MAG: hypothetical protein O3C40_13805 [Planctomycetota bacterium]|nr:hypothetical protein [Planctomycetota bacterium]
MPKTAAALSLLVAAFISPFVTAGDATSKPIRALIITEGCCRDYDFRTNAIKQAAADRDVNVDWTVVNEGGNGTHAQITLYEREDRRDASGDLDQQVRQGPRVRDNLRTLERDLL